eukprot:222380-Pelagomonas_calceolata.AAC.4
MQNFVDMWMGIDADVSACGKDFADMWKGIDADVSVRSKLTSEMKDQVGQVDSRKVQKEQKDNTRGQGTKVAEMDD